MESAIRCRTADVADAEFCLEQDSAVTQAYVTRKIAAGECYVAESGGELAGYLRLEMMWGLVPHIGIVQVADSVRVKGVGRALVEHVRGLMRAKGERFLFSSAGAADQGTRSWHEKIGFEACGEIRGVLEGEEPEVFYRLKT
jgi:GNAT superfamily N-acetyltransferase